MKNILYVLIFFTFTANSQADFRIRMPEVSELNGNFTIANQNQSWEVTNFSSAANDITFMTLQNHYVTRGQGFSYTIGNLNNYSVGGTGYYAITTDDRMRLQGSNSMIVSGENELILESGNSPVTLSNILIPNALPVGTESQTIVVRDNSTGQLRSMFHDENSFQTEMLSLSGAANLPHTTGASTYQVIGKSVRISGCMQEFTSDAGDTNGSNVEFYVSGMPTNIQGVNVDETMVGGQYAISGLVMIVQNSLYYMGYTTWDATAKKFKIIAVNCPPLSGASVTYNIQYRLK